MRPLLKKKIFVVVLYLISFPGTIFWFSFCLFQSASKLEFLQSLFGWYLGNIPFWFLVRKELKCNKQLQKGGKCYFLFGSQIWLDLRKEKNTSVNSKRWKETFCLDRGRCKFCNIPGTDKINGPQITFVRLRFKTLHDRKNSLLLSRSLFFSVWWIFFFSNFHVTKVKEVTPFMMKIETLLN